MLVDFVGCFVIEVTCKYLFADLTPRPFVTKGRERREKRREFEEKRAAEEAEMRMIEALEKKAN